MSKLSYWIKERCNPQLGIYFVPMGQMTVEQAKKYEKPKYGYNTMHRFGNEGAYLNEIKRLRGCGERVND